MSETTKIVAACLVAATFLAGAPETLRAQDAATPGARSEIPDRLKLSGPRFGLTVFTGDVADQRDLIDKEPMMTQFGWQFETQILSTERRSQALLEWVFLMGGLEQSELNLSLAWLAGYRLENGLEFGVGPNFSVNKDQGVLTTSMVVAGGSTLPFGDIHVPLNLAVGIAEGGPRFTVLMGWIVGS